MQGHALRAFGPQRQLLILQLADLRILFLKLLARRAELLIVLLAGLLGGLLARLGQRLGLLLLIIRFQLRAHGFALTLSLSAASFSRCLTRSSIAPSCCVSAFARAPAPRARS